MIIGIIGILLVLAIALVATAFILDHLVFNRIKAIAYDQLDESYLSMDYDKQESTKRLKICLLAIDDLDVIDAKFLNGFRNFKRFYTKKLTDYERQYESSNPSPSQSGS